MGYNYYKCGWLYSLSTYEWKLLKLPIGQKIYYEELQEWHISKSKSTNFVRIGCTWESNDDLIEFDVKTFMDIIIWQLDFKPMVKTIFGEYHYKIIIESGWRFYNLVNVSTILKTSYDYLVT